MGGRDAREHVSSLLSYGLDAMLIQAMVSDLPGLQVLPEGFNVQVAEDESGGTRILAGMTFRGLSLEGPRPKQQDRLATTAAELPDRELPLGSSVEGMIRGAVRHLGPVLIPLEVRRAIGQAEHARLEAGPDEEPLRVHELNTSALDLATELKNTAFCPASLSSAGLGSVLGRAWDTSDVTA